MNNLYIEEYTNNLERVLSTSYITKYSTSALEKLISYSSYFQDIEEDAAYFAPLVSDVSLIKTLFPFKKIELLAVPTYKECLWAAEAYLRIQGDTGLTFECIFLYIPIKKMYEYYPIYHEMDFSHIIKEFNRLFKEKSVFAILIEKNPYSLKSLAKDYGVSYDMLCSIKQRRRDIKKASAEIVINLAHLLDVRVETLAETSFKIKI